ncbi:lipid II flippase MurJ [uncultured Planococcus sp.]|uniref:lipid II flippase MurJ n=1 Tax=uncultured Planococcus sp. TaxID=337815 RepID=UPI00260E0C11|nr:lipid II flippase MurJ [uncultured Planococcus sp.]
MYSRVEEKERERKSLAYTTNLLKLLLIFATRVGIFGLIFPKPWERLFASGFIGRILELAIFFTRIGIFGIYFAMTISILNTYLNMKKYYVTPNLITLSLNIVFIALTSSCCRFILKMKNQSIKTIHFGWTLFIV